jgi:phage terminase large subunit
MSNRCARVEIEPGKINPVYRPYLSEMARVQIYFGGASSGKSVFLAQRDVIDVMNGGRNFLVVRQVAHTLRGSVIQEITKVIGEWGLRDLFTINKTDGTVTCRNGYQIVFAGLDDVEKLKSLTPAKGVFTDVRIEEATETDYRDIKQLLKRQRGGDEGTPKRLVMSFNPILQSHWIFEEYFKNVGWADAQTEYHGQGLSILKTTYKDNRFLTSDDIFGLENETDKYFRDVYTYGNWGILGHVIFTNWRIANLNDGNSADYLPEAQRTNPRNGLDFGYSSDPAALWVSHYDRTHKTIYLYDELYETGLTNDVLATRLKPKLGEQMVTCDSAEPKSIAELRQYGVSAYPATKGKDSVNFGIQWLQQQTIVVDTRCINAQNEFRQYHWKEDAGGNRLPIPIAKHDHLIDAGRYALEGDMDRMDAESLVAFA